MADCLFCKIATKELGSDNVYESDDVLAFRDINPAAQTHVLVIPKRHIASVDDLNPGDAGLLGEMFEAMVQIAREAGLTNGYRVVTNIGRDAGQSVHHLHFHVLGGRSMAWPPG
ncbi:MAG TPA: histidine triad nucleotide-binding protein [Actinomycetota bacterium]|nr:histidine triad nucleotide-binding protein [Actinomycetota bacterium]